MIKLLSQLNDEKFKLNSELHIKIGRREAVQNEACTLAILQGLLIFSTPAKFRKPAKFRRVATAIC